MKVGGLIGEVEFKCTSKTKNSTICKDTDRKDPKKPRKTSVISSIAFYNTKRKVRWCKQCFIQIPLERDWPVELKLEDMGEREGLQVVITEILAPGELKQRRGVECSWIHVCSTIHLTSSCVNLGTFVNLQ